MQILLPALSCFTTKHRHHAMLNTETIAPQHKTSDQGWASHLSSIVEGEKNQHVKLLNISIRRYINPCLSQGKLKVYFTGCDLLVIITNRQDALAMYYMCVQRNWN